MTRRIGQSDGQSQGHRLLCFLLRFFFGSRAADWCVGLIGMYPMVCLQRSVHSSPSWSQT